MLGRRFHWTLVFGQSEVDDSSHSKVPWFAALKAGVLVGTVADGQQ